MAYDKVVDSAVLDEGLKQIADAIREKAGTTDALAFPQEIADAIAAIKSNGEELVITDFSYFHYYGARSDLIGKVDTSKATRFKAMFRDCSNLTAIPELDISNAVEVNEMFYSCDALTTIPKLDTSKVTNANSMFYSCGALTFVPELDTSKVTNFSSMFYYCDRLVTISGLDLSKGTSCSSIVSYCKELTNLYLYNIRKTIQIGSGTSWGHLLTVDSLVHTIKELCTVTSSKTLTIGSANLEKIANLYCRITDDTNEKKTMELCESTDEGAMTLHDYASEKNWLIQ